jgi:hypothetical protein
MFLDQLLELSRKAAESSLQTQQAIWRQWTQGWVSAAPGGLSSDWGGDFRHRWAELALEALNKHRESIDANYRTVILTSEKALRVFDAKTSDDSLRAMEDIWKTVSDAFKAQTEAGLREVQIATERFVEMARKQAAGQPPA